MSHPDKTPSLPDRPPEELLVLGVGNEYRRDDGAGLFLVELLSGDSADGANEESAFRIEARSSGGNAFELISIFDGEAGRNPPRSILLVDAMSSGSPPGHLRFHSPDDPALQGSLVSSSTHDFGPLYALRLREVLGHPPVSVLVAGIEGENFEEGKGLSPVVEETLRKLALRIRKGELPPFPLKR